MYSGIAKRLPRWFKDDPLVKVFNDEIEEIKLDKYYKTMCQHVYQPIQIWREIGGFDDDYNPIDIILYARVSADSKHPIRSIELYNIDGVRLLRETFTKNQKITRRYVSVEHDAEQFYVEVKYWDIGASKKGSADLCYRILVLCNLIV